MLDVTGKTNFKEIVESNGLTAEKARKNPVIINVCCMPDAFCVATREGKMAGAKGDYLMEGVEGELYPCGKEIFEKTYTIISDE